MKLIKIISEIGKKAPSIESILELDGKLFDLIWNWTNAEERDKADRLRHWILVKYGYLGKSGYKDSDKWKDLSEFLPLQKPEILYKMYFDYVDALKQIRTSNLGEIKKVTNFRELCFTYFNKLIDLIDEEEEDEWYKLYEALEELCSDYNITLSGDFESKDEFVWGMKHNIDSQPDKEETYKKLFEELKYLYDNREQYREHDINEIKKGVTPEMVEDADRKLYELGGYNREASIKRDEILHKYKYIENDGINHKYDNLGHFFSLQSQEILNKMFIEYHRAIKQIKQ